MLIPGTADAQDATPSTDRERSSFIVFAPSRIGFLIPINDRWMIRPDFGGRLRRTGEPGFENNVIAGVSLVRRSAPRDGGWTYAALRYGVVHQFSDGYAGPNLTQFVTATTGAHARVLDWLDAFGEAGFSFGYQEIRSTGTRPEVATEGGMVARIGLGLHRAQRTRISTVAALAAEAPGERERPSWVIGGAGTVGMLIPLSARWVVRPEFGTYSRSERGSFSQTNTDIGISLLRRTEPTERGWAYAAFRYGLGHDQRYADPPSWIHFATVTAGAHARLRDRLGVFAEAGLSVRYADQHWDSGTTYSLITANPIQRVGLTYRWKDGAR